MAYKKSSDKPDNQFYGRKLGRPLSASRQSALDALLPLLGIPPENLQKPAALNTQDIFPNPSEETWMEIGFGDGVHLSAMMRRYQNVNFIGVEPFVNGMSCFLKDIETLPHDNIRIYMDDAMQVVHALAGESIERLYILNPDPWHKKRHNKRRIVNPKNLDEFSRILKPGGQLIMSTDVPYLAEWMVTHTARHPDFKWTAKSSNDWKTPPKDWITTTYEVKGAKGADKMSYLIFQKTLA